MLALHGMDAQEGRGSLATAQPLETDTLTWDRALEEHKDEIGALEAAKKARFSIGERSGVLGSVETRNKLAGNLELEGNVPNGPSAPALQVPRSGTKPEENVPEWVRLLGLLRPAIRHSLLEALHFRPESLKVEPARPGGTRADPP